MAGCHCPSVGNQRSSATPRTCPVNSIEIKGCDPRVLVHLSFASSNNPACLFDPTFAATWHLIAQWL